MAELDAAGIKRLAIFTGDGSLNAAITNLYGWGGKILVLPGGTMNLLCKRLNGLNTTLAKVNEAPNMHKLRLTIAKGSMQDMMMNPLADT